MEITRKEELKKEIIKLINEGLTHKEISIILGERIEKITSFCKRNKIKSKSKEIKSKEVKENIICLNCNIDFIANKKDNRKFCCASCSATFNNKNKINPNKKKKIRIRKDKENTIKYSMISNEDFIKICNESDSMANAFLKFNLSYSKFKKIATELKCFKTNRNWNKNKNFTTDERIKSKYKLEDFFTENSNQSRSRVKELIIKLNLFEYKCSNCKLYEWDNKSISLHLDHINGIRNDNRLENLRFLCPNCHSQTETYCNKNKGSIKIENINIEDIANSIINNYTMTSVVLDLGIVDTKLNRLKIENIIQNNNLCFKVKDVENQVIDVSQNIIVPIKNDTKICMCGKELHSSNISGCCSICILIKQRKTERPTYEQLLSEINELGYCAVGRKYNVSDVSIKKWIKFYEKHKKQNEN